MADMITTAQRNPQPSISPEAVRERLLRPLPNFTFRSLLFIFIAVGFLSWSLSGVGASAGSE